jgi:hypothetical protein
MYPHSFLRTAALSLALLLIASSTQAATPTRVARLGYVEGEVSFLQAGDADWVQASVNRPLTTGDQLWTDRSAVSEIQLEGAAFRMGELSNVTVLNLDDQITQLQLSQGALRLRVRSLRPQQSIEVDTPNLAMVLRNPGDYRIQIDPQGDATLVLVQRGQAEVFGDAASYRVDSGQAFRFYGTGLSDYEVVSDYRADELDRWAQERERRLDNSASARYVPAGVVGYEDLDSNGRWVVDASYGNVWLPNRVDAGWTPYRDGRWTWVAPWGWTWIDDAPWGYAVSHYGRWAYFGNAWGWVPGAVRERVVYAPALVGFVGGNQSRNPPERRAGMGNTSWFPLGPRDVYRPGQSPAREGYANQHVRGAVVTPVNQPPRERAPDAEARRRPPRDNHQIVARTAPPAPGAAAAPAQSGSPAEPPVRVRIVTPAAAPIAAPAGVEPKRGEATKREAARSEESRVNAAKADASRADAMRAEAARAEVDRNAAAQVEVVRARAAQERAARAAETTRNNAARADAVKTEAAKAQSENAVRTEKSRVEQARPPSRKPEAQPGNAQKPDRELTPEELLLLRGKPKQ